MTNTTNIAGKFSDEIGDVTIKYIEPDAKLIFAMAVVLLSQGLSIALIGQELSGQPFDVEPICQAVRAIFPEAVASVKEQKFTAGLEGA